MLILNRVFLLRVVSVSLQGGEVEKTRNEKHKSNKKGNVKQSMKKRWLNEEAAGKALRLTLP